MKPKRFSDDPLKKYGFQRIQHIGRLSVTVFSEISVCHRHFKSWNQKKLHSATYIHNYISINDFSNIQQANHEKQSISFLLHKQLVHKDKRNFYRFPCKKEKTKKEAGRHARKTQHQKYGKFNKNTAKKVFANKKMLKFSSIITSINTMQ